MRAPLREFHEGSTLVAPPPPRLLADPQHLVQLVVTGTVLSERMRPHLAHGADPGPALATDDIEGVFGVDLGAWRNEIVATWVGTENALLPGGAELQHRLEE